MSTSAITPAVAPGSFDGESGAPVPAINPSAMRTVAYPNGNVVAFPPLSEQDFANAARSVWGQLSNTVSNASAALGGPADLSPATVAATKAALQHPVDTAGMVVGSVINGLKTAAAQVVPFTDENQALVDKAEAAWQAGNHVQAAAHLVPLVGDNLAKTVQQIQNKDVSGAIGTGLGTALPFAFGSEGASPEFQAAEGANAAEAAARTIPRAKPNLRPIAAPEAGEVKAPAPMTPTERAASAYVRKAYGTDSADVQILGHQANEAAPSEVKHGTEMLHEQNAVATDDDVNAFLRQHFGDNAPTVTIVNDKPAVKPSSAEINEAAAAEAKKLSQRPTFKYSKDEGDLLNTHRVDVTSDSGANGYVTATEPTDNPKVWTLDRAEIQPPGTGAGTQAYRQLAREAQRQGAELRSGSVVSEPAQKVWQKLKDSGLNVQEVPGAGGMTYRIPAPAAAHDITDEMEHALQAPQPLSPTSRIAMRAKALAADESGEMTVPFTGTQRVIPGTGVEEKGAEPADTRPDVPAFYSKVGKIVDDKMQGKAATGSQILATLRNNGAKEDEIKWMGLDDFLKDKPKVSKDDLQQFINDNQIRLQEINRPANGIDAGSLNAEKNNLHDYITAVQGRNADSPLGKAIGTWLAGEGPESTSKLLSHPDMTPELASQVSRYDQLDEQLKTAPERSAKYAKYVLDGPKENYNEKLLTLPYKNPPVLATEASKAFESFRSEMAAKYGKNEDNGYGLNADQLDSAERGHLSSLREAASKEEAGNQRAQREAGYNGPHFEEPNILAHVRHDDRIDTDGKKSLFLEELQSDWHQTGKQEGYRKPVDRKEIARQLDVANDEYQRLEKQWNQTTGDETAKEAARQKMQEAYRRTVQLSDAYNAAAANRGVPEAPFRNDWHELVMKRMLREAAEKGYDRLSWTTGEQQAARYDLSKEINRLEYDPEAGELTAYDHDDQQVISERVDPDAESLAKYIGKEPAQKLADQIENYSPGPSSDDLWDMYADDYRIREIPGEEDEDGNEGEPRYGVFAEWHSGEEPIETFDSEHRAENYVNEAIRDNVNNYESDGDSEKPSLHGLDLKVGGEWAEALYDRAIPNFLNKYLKKWGGKVGTSYIPVETGEGLPYELVSPSGRLYDAFRTRQQAQDALKSMEGASEGTGWTIRDKSPNDEKVHSIDITPEMRKSFMKEGQPISQNKPSWATAAEEGLAA